MLQREEQLQGQALEVLDHPGPLQTPHQIHGLGRRLLHAVQGVGEFGEQPSPLRQGQGRFGQPGHGVDRHEANVRSGSEVSNTGPDRTVEKALAVLIDLFGLCTANERARPCLRAKLTPVVPPVAAPSRASRFVAT